MVLDRENKGEKGRSGNRILAMYRPAVQDLAKLHASGQIHGNISPEAIDVRSRIWFCFPLTAEAAKGYGTKQKIHLPLANQKAGSEHDGSSKGEPDKRRQGIKGNFLRSGWTVKDDVEEIEKLRTITFLDHIPMSEGKKWDVSDKKDGSVMAWLEGKDGKYALYIGSDGVTTAGERCRYMFYNCRKLKAIHFNNNFDTSQVTDMTCMFGFCSNLEELDVSSFDTSQVINMQNMFSGCTHLEKLNINGFNTSKVINMMAMFSNCSRLTSLDVSGFDTSRVEDMELMFFKCSALKKLNVSGFNTSRVTNMSFMFWNCVHLEELDVSGFDTSQVTDMRYMFGLCSGLKKLDWTALDMSGVKDYENMLTGTQWEGQEKQ